MVKPTDRPFVVGYALLPKKAAELHPALSRGHRSPARRLSRPHRPLAEQGPFDCVIHKLHGDEWKAQLWDFAANNPSVPIVDQPLAIERLRDRIAMLQFVSELDVPHETETFGVPNQALIYDHSPSSLSGITDLRFPIIAKPLVSDGSAKSHGMSLVYELAALLCFKPPLVLQEFVNHGGVIFKVYVAGNYVQCTRRKSLPDVSPEQHRSVASVTFSHVSNTPSQSHLEAAELSPSSFLEKIAMGLRHTTGLHLFNFDMIRDVNGHDHYLIIRHRLLPRLLQVPRYEKFMTDFFWNMVLLPVLLSPQRTFFLQLSCKLE